MATSPVSFAEALEAILATAKPLPAETVPLTHAKGRTLAASVLATRDQPPTPLSAMDGYAVRSGDQGPLTLDGATPAGADAGSALASGSARRIFTGAPLPDGADAVLVQEDARLIDGMLHFDTKPSAGTFVRPTGFDFTAGDALLPAGHVLDARAVALCAAANQPTVEVRRTPKISILATGSELRFPGSATEPQHVVASNGLCLAALLDGRDCGFVGDSVNEIAAAIGEAIKGQDLLITTGGASVGDHDLVQAALERLGATRTFWKVMMRPGKPVFLWDLHGVPVLGLPGNPVSAYVCARMLALPWIKASLGQPDIHERRLALPLAAPLSANGPRHQFARATFENGGLAAAKSQDSSLLRTLASAAYLIERAPHDPPRNVGDMVKALRL